MSKTKGKIEKRNFCFKTEEGKFIDIENINNLPMYIEKENKVLFVVDVDSENIYVRYIDITKPFYIEI